MDLRNQDSEAGSYGFNFQGHRPPPDAPCALCPTKQSTRANALHDFKSRAIACRAPKPSQGLRNFTSTHQVRLRVVASHDEKRATRFRVARNHEGKTPRRFQIVRNQVEGITTQQRFVLIQRQVSTNTYRTL